MAIIAGYNPDIYRIIGIAHGIRSKIDYFKG
jgi:hypothetical protein